MTSQPPRSYTRFAIAIVIAAVVIGAIIFALYLGIGGVNPGASTNHIDINSISVSGFSICPSNCIYPAPYVSGEILVNGSVPISSVMISVNGTYDGLALQNPTTTTIACSTAVGQTCSIELGATSYSSGTYTSITKYYATCSVPANSTSCSATYTGSVNTLTEFAELYKGSVPNGFIPVVQGDTYVFTFVATFQDGSTSTATVSVVAA